jgi:hypothetical protein
MIQAKQKIRVSGGKAHFYSFDSTKYIQAQKERVE